ncbi:MAG: glucosidase, partial [Phycisphaerae bacterium]|nr:glucosidase [Phycisphaerae bacterium]
LEFDRESGRGLLAIPSRERLASVLHYVLDEKEFLSPHGLRSMSRVHAERPYSLKINGEEFSAEYEPAETKHRIFGGNSNWRGPVWFPLNHLFIEVLDRYHYAFGDTFQVECPTGSGKFMNLGAVARILRERLASLFVPGEAGHRPCHGSCGRFAGDPHWKDLLLFHEYFHGDDGTGL